MPLGAAAAGLEDVRGPGITDPFLTIRMGEATIAGAAAVTATVDITEAGVYEVWASAFPSVQPAPRSLDLDILRGVATAELDLGALRVGGGNEWGTRPFLVYLLAGDTVRFATGAGAVGDSGTVRVYVRRVGR